jgi:hypothetical protein
LYSSVLSVGCTRALLEVSPERYYLGGSDR